MIHYQVFTTICLGVSKKYFKKIFIVYHVSLKISIINVSKQTKKINSKKYLLRGK